MSGTIPLSMTQQFDEFGAPLAGGLLYIIQAGTVSTPQDSFQDNALTIKNPNPITMDAAGRLPQFFLADGFIKIRMTDAGGIVQRQADGIQVIGPSGGGGGGGSTVDPTTLIQTGNMILRYGSVPLAGYVRLNGFSIGSATSGANERANADCQALFVYLWGVDTTLAVSGGRGASALADWTANKQLTLPDWRGYAIGGLDGFGNVASGRLSPQFFGSDPTILGAIGGGEYWVLTAAQIPAVGFSGTTGADFPDHGHTVEQATSSGAQKPAGTGNAPFDTNVPASSAGANTRHQHSFSGAINGGGGAHRTIGPRKQCGIYIKL